MQWQLVAVPAVETSRFNASATELQRGVKWRYGYVLQYHGAVLVKTRTRNDAPPLRAPRANDRLSAIMARELRLDPWKASAELAFYAGLFMLYRLGRRAMSRLKERAALTRLQCSAAIALSTGVFVTAVMTPYLLVGYGEPLFSTWQGFGALSSSGLVPTTAPVVPSVSYRAYFQAVLIWPLMCAQWAAEPLSALLGIRGSLWCVAVLFWSAIAALAASLAYRSEVGLKEGRYETHRRLQRHCASPTGGRYLQTSSPAAQPGGHQPLQQRLPGRAARGQLP